MPKKYISESVKQAVDERAGGRCEYCMSLRKYSPQPFIIEHIIPRIKGGSDALNNLALSCGGCNGHKYQKTEATDPITGVLVPLFHPRHDDWFTHFEWDVDYLQVIGITPVGRATERALYLNREELINLRALVKMTGEHPPLKE